MDVMLSPIRMATTLPGRMSMHTPAPMYMHIHPGIMSPIIILIEREVRRHTPLETGVLAHACFSALPLELDNRLRPSCSTEPTHDVNQQLGQALGQIGLREECLGIPIINGPSSSEDFAQVGSED